MMKDKYFLLAIVGQQSGVRSHLSAKAALGKYPEQFKELLEEMTRIAKEQKEKNNAQQMKLFT